MISHYSIKLRQVSLISLLALLLISVIGAAMADTTPMKPSNAPYQLSDLDKASAAPLQIMTPAVSAVMTDTVLLSDPLAVASVPAISSEIGSTADETSEPELLSKTTLSPGVTIDGLACNILHTPIGKHRWSILQYDLSLDTDNQTAVFVSDEDTTIQSVSCSADGSQVLMAIQDGVGGDSEIYLIDQTNNEILRLTDNDTDDLDVSMSQDGRVITWQGRLADDRKAVFVRTIADDGSYSDIALGSKYPMTQPSLSPNGEWLVMVNERKQDHIVRYQLSTSEFTTLKIVDSSLWWKVEDPSISDNGNKAFWIESVAGLGQIVMFADSGSASSEEVFRGEYPYGYGIEHAMVSGDGEALIYSVNTSGKRFTYLRLLSSGAVFRLGKVLRDDNRYLGNQLNASVGITSYEITTIAVNGSVGILPESDAAGYLPGDTVTLSVSADSGYVFESWESVGGECSGEQTTCSFVMPQNNVEVTANFKVLVKVNAIGIAGHDLAVLEDGTLMHWDSGIYSSPTPPNGLTDVAAVSTSGDHSVALKSDGTIVGWGEYAGYSGLHNWSEDSPVKDAVAVATGYNTTVILFADGTAKGYGIGGSDVPEGLSDVVAVAGGYESSVVLKSDGTVNSWGNSLLKVPEDWSGIAAISTNLDSSIMALKRDGTIVYSSPTYQDPGAVPAELNDAVAIAGAGRTAVVLRNNGTIVTWSEGIISVLWEGDEEIVAITPSLALTSGGRVIGLRGNFVPPELALD